MLTSINDSCQPNVTERLFSLLLSPLLLPGCRMVTWKVSGSRGAWIHFWKVILTLWFLCWVSASTATRPSWQVVSEVKRKWPVVERRQSNTRSQIHSSSSGPDKSPLWDELRPPRTSMLHLCGLAAGASAGHYFLLFGKMYYFKLIKHT